MECVSLPKASKAQHISCSNENVTVGQLALLARNVPGFTLKISSGKP